jgi:hypothetical protein
MKALIAALLAAAVVGACNFMPQKQEIPVSHQLAPAEQEVQRIINRATATLAASYGVVADNVTAEVMTKAEGRAWIVELDKGRDKVIQAQQLLDKGILDVAKLDAAAVDKVLTLLQGKINEQARKAKEQKK